ncbi:MAG: hypothetical protein R2785_05510 [Flavobacteriaceae bacterium]
MTYRICFIIGLIFLLTGQLLLAQGNDFVYSQSPIDFAHWFLLVGVVCLIPQVVTFPKSIFSVIGIPLTLIGIASMIGMCVLDFIFWSYPNDQMRNEFASHVTQVPSIWKTFITIGPSSKVFNVGLLILSLNYLSTKKIAIGILLIACLILWHAIPVPFRLVFGYSLTLVSFALILLGKQEKDELKFSQS